MRVKNYRRAIPTSRPALSRRALIAMLLLLSAGATRAAWTNGSENETAPAQRKPSTPGAARSRYVAIPHGADTELRRRGAYLARKLNLPLIAETTVKGVVIKEFRP